MPAAHGEALPCPKCLETLPLYPGQASGTFVQVFVFVVFGGKQGGTECEFIRC
jgi:hypothetical protein